LPSTYVYCGTVRNNPTLLTPLPSSSWKVTPNTISTSFFHELHPEYNSKDFTNFYLPNTDIPVNTILNTMLTYYEENYSFAATKQSFSIWYQYERQEKVAFDAIINISGTSYLIGTGIDLADFIDKSILSHGDVISTGQFTVSDENDQDIFKVDTVNKTTSNMYNMGIGVKNPQTALDVFDSGVQDIINVINQLAQNISTINHNYSSVVNKIHTDISNNPSSPNFDDVTALFNPSGGSFLDPFSKLSPLPVVTQSVDSYYVVSQVDLYDAGSTEYLYFWLYPNWQGTPISQIVDNNNNAARLNAITVFDAYNKTNFVFDKGFQVWSSHWIFGERTRVSRSYEDPSNNKYYMITVGVNLQSNNLRFSTNLNISKFTNYMDACSLYLQYLYLTCYKNNNISITNIPNYDAVETYMNILYQSYPINCSTSITEYTLDFGTAGSPISTRYSNTIVSSSNDLSNNFDPSYNSSATSYSTTDKNTTPSQRIKMYSYYGQLVNYYPNISTGDYGIVYIEDQTYDYVSLFYVIDVSGTKSSAQQIVKLVSIELKINDIIKPSLSVHGDANVTGDLSVSTIDNSGNTVPYVSIDTTQGYFGVGTNERIMNYSNKFSSAISTTNSVNNASYNMYVKGYNFPNAVFERISEKTTDISAVDISNNSANDVSNNYSSFRTFSAANIRRRSDIYSFANMYKYSNTLAKNTTLSDGVSSYGSDIEFELTDKTNFTQRLGKLGWHIENMDLSGNVKGSFSASVVDVSASTPEYNVQPRKILYTTNASTLYTTNLIVGNSYDPSNGNPTLVNNNANQAGAITATRIYLGCSGETTVAKFLFTDTSGSLYWGDGNTDSANTKLIV
jgi:hypothetical protein